MSRRTPLLFCVVAALFFLNVPVVAFAQQDAGIIGVVTDESGAVLPGVTVTVTGPALQVPSMSVKELRTCRGTWNFLANSMLRECMTPAPTLASSSISS